MPLANYTSEASPVRSVDAIEKMLVEHGAKRVMKEYDNGEIVGIAFSILTVQGELPFRLPAKIANVEVILRKRRKNYDRLYGREKVSADLHDKEQAKKTAWANLRDWTRAQLALIEIDQVTIDQVFFPYLQYKGRTVYQIFTEGKLLGPVDGEFHEVK
jgi:hypothetical protein